MDQDWSPEERAEYTKEHKDEPQNGVEVFSLMGRAVAESMMSRLCDYMSEEEVNEIHSKMVTSPEMDEETADRFKQIAVDNGDYTLYRYVDFLMNAKDYLDLVLRDLSPR